ncbi:MAG: histidinol dehydrogenase [Methanomicrobiales archaeon]|jgi:histidinol dehydrogenase|nr:histidinol dehydrogenase [Methanomicrobiales archaeon]
MLRHITVNQLVEHRFASFQDASDALLEIIPEVASRGDEALFEFTKRFDGVSLDTLMVSEESIQNAFEEVDDEILQALMDAFERIVMFHQLQKEKDLWLHEMGPGILLGMKVTPLERIGIYVPGGKAAYPSTVLMCAAPARIAGVSEICLCTPPGENGPSALTLVACAICGIDEIYQVGGAQAIAAMAYGTESIPCVDKIVGPGNAYVAAAKRFLQGTVAIDFLAGPSEVVIIADDSADAMFVAADIIAQCEHDPSAVAILITPSESFAALVDEKIKIQVKKTARKEIVSVALQNAGVIFTSDLDEAVSVANAIAPEHLSVQVAEPLALLSQIQNAGSIFIGSYAPVACGDYASGTNHVLPTAGEARRYSGLNVSHFTKSSTVQVITKEGLMQIHDTVEKIADAEGLQAHADSVRIRLDS